MARFGSVISLSDGLVRVYDHDTGASIRSLGVQNNSWSPYYTSEYDPSTGLPLAAFLGPEDMQNPCSISADGVSVYIFDSMTCRVLRYDPQSGVLQSTFGGRRGIGVGRITPDPTRRSIIARANNKTWITDNEGDQIARYDSVGGISADNTWAADYAISTLSALAGVSFDQITGITWDAIRQNYWILASGSAATYLIALNSDLSQARASLDLTARLGVPGHGGTSPGRLLTRHVRFVGGFLYIWSQNTLYKIDPTAVNNDTLLYTTAVPICGGTVSADDVEATLTLQTGSSQVLMVKVLSLPSAEIVRAYAPNNGTTSPVAGEVRQPWDSTVTPYLEDTATHQLQTISARANIRGVTIRNLQARAHIRGTTTQTLQARAHILQGVQQRITLRARIEAATALPDSIASSWDVSDALGQFSQQFSVNASEIGKFQVGNEITIYAGYDLDRVRLITGKIDSVQISRTSRSRQYRIDGRNFGADEYNRIPITKTWISLSGVITPTSHEIVRDIAAQVGLSVGVLEFPDYKLYNSFHAVGMKLFQILGQLIEPWDIFKSSQYVPIIRDNTLHVIKVDFKNISSNGYIVNLNMIASAEYSQELYLEEPRLNEVDFMLVRGATYIRPVLAVPFTRIEYFKTDVPLGTLSTLFGPLQVSAQTETSVLEVVFGDKVVSRREVVNSVQPSESDPLNQRMETISEITESYFYFEPGEGTAQSLASGADTITYQSMAPSPHALLLGISSSRRGIVKFDYPALDNLGNPVLDASGNQVVDTRRDLLRVEDATTVYQYDKNNEVACEITTKLTYDYSKGLNEAVARAFGETTSEMRTHSKTTGNALYSHLSQFTFADSHFELDGVATQHVGGSRPDINNPLSRESVQTVQVQSPQGRTDESGNPIDFTQGGVLFDNIGGFVIPYRQDRFIWTFENNYIGQDDADRIYQNALDERSLQIQGFRWETVQITSSFNPNLYVGQQIHLEISIGTYRDYVVESVRHHYDGNSAMTNASAKRLTIEQIQDI